MLGLTDAERRGARVLALLLVLGTITDMVRSRHPDWAPPAGISPDAERSPVSRTDPAQAPDSARGATPASLDLNSATAEQLDALPGIGPVLAARIVEHRGRHGPFRHVDELLSVPGIGTRLLERVRPQLLEPPR